ncbi:MAG: ABC transporter permease subunit [Roseimicrobium sp.]
MMANHGKTQADAWRVLAPARRIWTLAAHTMTQLLRMRILWFLAAFCLLVLAAAFVFPKQSPEQQLKQLKDWALGAIHVSSIVFAIASTALLLPRDLEDRTLYTILSKPVPRYEYLIGKLLGVLLLIGGALVFMDLVFCAVLWMKQTVVAASQIAALQSEQSATEENVAVVRRIIAEYGLSWSIHAEVWMAFLRAAIVTALTLLISCVASTTLFTIVTACGYTVAGFGVQLMREWFLEKPYTVMEKVIGGVLAVLCPDLSLFNLAEPAARGTVIPWEVLVQLTGAGLLYVIGYTAVCYLFFVEKEL